ncbi:MAG: FCSD flavin-binding domain-containing protein [Thiohalomonadaceae bacterium]
MSTMISRRTFVQWMGAAGALGLAGCAMGGRSQSPGRVVVIGGGFGGATCARYLKRFSPKLAVTLVEPARQYVTCPFSNAVIAGLRDMDSITVGYEGLQRLGIEIVHDHAQVIDAHRREVRLAGGARLAYDRLVVAPGIDFRVDAIEGYGLDVAQTMPHAWKAGEQTMLLRRQLQAMRNGGVVVISVPGNPYRCPPGPYERASLIADYLSREKPRSKVVILDAKDSFPKQALFEEGWQELYPGKVEWLGGEGGRVTALDRKAGVLHNVFGAVSRKGDVVNLIPPQQAGALAAAADLTDASGWCPVDPSTFESTRHAGIHVIGDAAIAAPLPKSGYAANSEAKVCAAAIVTALEGGRMPAPTFINTCYSLLAEDYAVSVAGVYRVAEGKLVSVPGAGGVSPLGRPRQFRADEAGFARAWYRSIINDSFAFRA